VVFFVPITSTITQLKNKLNYFLKKGHFGTLIVA